MINPMDLTGKHIMVTGASAGIGREICVLASQLGAKISLVGRNKERLDETLSTMEGTGHKAFAFDLTQIDGIEGLLKSIVDEGGKLDGLVNSAGVAIKRPLKMTKPEFVREAFDINFFPFIELVRVAANKRMSNDGASIIGISSVAAAKGGKAQSAYAASKAAIEGALRPMAKELADRRIRVNAIEFGMINTDMYRSFLATGGTDEDLRGQYFGVGETRDAANATCFLLSDAARFITGSIMVVDGGFLS